jgi:hypothetical protein
MFATTANNAQMPVDADPHPEGMLRVRWRGDVLRVEVVPKARRAAVLATHGALYRSHFATCVDAAHYRRRK